jgi:hypothetical protein
MKRFTATALVMLAGICTAGSLHAQDHQAKATVPFSFVVGNKQLPAGTYLFSSESNDVLIIQNRTRPVGVVTLMDAADALPYQGHSHLSFTKYGDRYFLSEIRCSWTAMNGDIPRSKAEKQAQAQQASLELTTIPVEGN